MDNNIVTTEGFFSKLKQRFKNWRDDRRERKSFHSCEGIIATYGNSNWVHRQPMNHRSIRAEDLTGLLVTNDDRHLDVDGMSQAMNLQIKNVHLFLEKSKPSFQETALEVERILRRHLSYVTPSSMSDDVDSCVRELVQVESPMKRIHAKLDLPFKPKLLHHFLAGEESTQFFDAYGKPNAGVFEGHVMVEIQPLTHEDFTRLSAVISTTAIEYRQLDRIIRNWHTPSADDSVYVSQIERMCDGLSDHITSLKKSDKLAENEEIQRKILRLEDELDDMESAQRSLELALMNLQYWKARENLMLLAFAPIASLGAVLYRSTTTHVR